MAPYKQSRAELLDHLKEQLEFLRNSCDGFDLGFESEAKRLATTIRVLLHDTTRSRSLLRQLGVKDSIQMLDTAKPLRPQNLLSHHGLVVLRVKSPPNQDISAEFTILGEEEPFTPQTGVRKGSVTFEPRCNAPRSSENKQFVLFADWWHKVVIRDRNRNTFTREDLVLAMADREGGAHVDLELDEKYAALARLHSIGWQANVAGERRPPDNSVVAASVRQIAHEVILSLERTLPSVSR